jgi:hypothetical protein
MKYSFERVSVSALLRFVHADLALRAFFPFCVLVSAFVCHANNVYSPYPPHVLTCESELSLTAPSSICDSVAISGTGVHVDT